MVSVRARYQSLMTLSISDWISSSVPWRVFSWGRKSQRHLSPKNHHVKMYTGWSTVKPDSSSNTSMTCFLLDLSLEAHSTDPPRRSMVNSGFDWLLPNFWNQGNCMRLHVWHTDNITRTRCCFLCDFLSSVVLKAQTLNLLYGACHILKCWKLLWNSSCKHTSLV